MSLALISRIIKNHQSRFYRDLYSTIDIDAVRSLEELPFLTREHITTTPLWQRTYLPREAVHFIRNTYGTSGKRIIVTPRVMYGSYEGLYAPSGITRMVSLFASAHVGFPERVLGIATIFCDVKNFDASAALIKAFRPDCLYALPYSALILAEHLPHGVRAGIRLLQLTGERCSPLQYRVLSRLYPHARIASVYSASETREIVAEPCTASHTADHLIVHEVPSFHFELVEPETGRAITETDVAGELVLTTLAPDLPFPLIRYKTGDLAHLLPCSCEKGRGYEILGRLDVYPIKVMRGEINLPAVETALSAFDAYLYHTAEVHYLDVAAGGIAKAQVKLCVYPKENAPMPPDLAERFAERLEMFPAYSYAQGVTDGYYAPLSLEAITGREMRGKLPPIRFIRHT